MLLSEMEVKASFAYFLSFFFLFYFYYLLRLTYTTRKNLDRLSFLTLFLSLSALTDLGALFATFISL